MSDFRILLFPICMSMKAGYKTRMFLKPLLACICGPSVQFLMKPSKMVLLKEKNVILLEDAGTEFLASKNTKKALDLDDIKKIYYYKCDPETGK